jgi:WD40 repeat protein
LALALVLTAPLGGGQAVPKTDAPPPAAASAADPLPAGALARLGTARFRLGQYVGMAALSADGKHLAIQANGLELALLDTATGKQVQSIKTNGGGSRALLFAPDGKTLAMLDFSNSVRLWDVATGQQRSTLQTPPPPPAAAGQPQRFLQLNAAEFSADGKYLTACSETFGQPGAVFVWEVASTKLLGTFTPIQNQQIRSALSPDGKVLATWGQFFAHNPGVPVKHDPSPGRTIQLWDVPRGKELRRFEVDPQNPVTVASVTFAPDGKTLAVGSGLSTISLWDVAKGTPLRRFAGRRGYGTTLRFAPDGELLAALGPDGAVQIWETATWKRLSGGDGPRCRPVGLGFPAQGKVLACGMDGQALCLWEALTGRVLTPTGGHQHMIRAIAFRGQEVLSASADGKICRWDRATGKELAHDYLRDEDNPRFNPYPRQSGLAFSPDGKYVATESTVGNAGIRLWELATGKIVCDFDGPRSSGQTAVIFSPDSKRLAAVGMDKAVFLWDVTSGEEVRRLNMQEVAQPTGIGGSGRLALSPDGNLLAAAVLYFDRNIHRMVGEVYLWQATTGKEVARIRQENSQVTALAFSPDSKLLATAGNDRTVALWSTTKGQEVRRLEGAEGFLYALAFAPDGRTLAGAASQPGVVGGDQKIILWELASGQVRSHFTGHKGMISCLTFSMDGGMLASGSADTTVLLWDTSGRLLGKGAASRPADALWTDLASSRADQAFRAVGKLAGAPAVALPLLKERLRPVEGKKIDAKGLQKLIEDLDSPKFALREKANRDLERLGELAGPALEGTLKGDISPELRRRIEKLLARLDKAAAPPEELRALRGVEVLERIGTAEAREILTALAEGAPGAPLTIQARAALERLNEPR